MIIDGVKFSCGPCVKGHRQANCNHGDRELFEVKKRGRPITACAECREIRKTTNAHKTCTHCSKADVHEPQLIKTLPHGVADPKSMALIRRSSSTRSRSSASSSSHPPPVSTSSPSSVPSTAAVAEEEDLSTVGRKKSVSKSRRKDSTAAQKPHDLSHGHAAHHPAHQFSQFAPYPQYPLHHPPNHAPLSLPEPPPHHSQPQSHPQQKEPNPDLSFPPAVPFQSPRLPPPAPRPLTNEDLASSFFFRGFDNLETASLPSLGVNTESNISSSGTSSFEGVASTREGIDGGTNGKGPARYDGIEGLPIKGIATVRPIKERKRSGLAQVYGAPDEEEEEEQHPVYASVYSEVPEATTTSASADTTPAFALPSCDYSLPRKYTGPIAAYSSTAPSAYSAYSGYTTPDLVNPFDYAHSHHEDDSLVALADAQPQQQTDLDILEWIATIAPLPPASTPATAADHSLADAAFGPPPTIVRSSTTPPYSEPTPAAVPLSFDAGFDFSALELSPTDFRPAPALSTPPALSTTGTTASTTESSAVPHDSPFRLDEDGDDMSASSAPFDASGVHLEAYGIDEAYFAQLGSFAPTATPASTPVSDALAGWEKRMEMRAALDGFGGKLQTGQLGRVQKQQEGQEGQRQLEGQEWWQAMKLEGAV
ncbi:hypothetical protein JCM1840_004920 [Sporobolomyces johnsonii]